LIDRCQLQQFFSIGGLAVLAIWRQSELGRHWLTVLCVVFMGDDVGCIGDGDVTPA
jgi:hypothetical protein